MTLGIWHQETAIPRFGWECIDIEEDFAQETLCPGGAHPVGTSASEFACIKPGGCVSEGNGSV